MATDVQHVQENKSISTQKDTSEWSEWNMIYKHSKFTKLPKAYFPETMIMASLVALHEYWILKIPIIHAFYT